MKYNPFYNKTKDSFLINIFQKKDIVEVTNKFIKVDTYPDADLIDYQRGITSGFYFRNNWKYSGGCSFILDVCQKSQYIFHPDNINELNKDLNDLYSSPIDPDDYLDFLDEAFHQDSFTFESHSFPTDIEQFELKKIRIVGFDNNKQQITYEGYYIADDIDTLYDGFLVNQLEITGINCYKTLTIYQELLLEAFLLKEGHRYNLAYYLIYSALENYVNTKLDTVNERGDFEDKVRELCKRNISGDASKHEIYTQIIPKLKDFTLKRNDLVHGRTIAVSYQDCDSFLHFTLSVIALNTWKNNTFKELYDLLY